jgi:hypothetical protein
VKVSEQSFLIQENQEATLFILFSPEQIEIESIKENSLINQNNRAIIIHKSMHTLVCELADLEIHMFFRLCILLF